MGWNFSLAWVEEYSRRDGTDTEPSAPSKSKNIPEAYYCDDKTKDDFRRSRSGMIFARLTEPRGEELLTSFREDFRAKTSPPPEEEPDSSRVRNHHFGLRCFELFAKYDPNTFSWKTPADLFNADSPFFSEVWPNAGSMRNGSCWVRETSGRPIYENELGFSLGTLTTRDAERSAKYRRKNLTPAEFVAMFPTLTTKGFDGGSNSRKKLKKIGALPTLTVNGNYNRRGVSKTSGNGLATVLGGKLNPEWCEWFMGFPGGWTALGDSETPKSPFAPRPLSKSSTTD